MCDGGFILRYVLDIEQIKRRQAFDGFFSLATSFIPSLQISLLTYFNCNIRNIFVLLFCVITKLGLELESNHIIE